MAKNQPLAGKITVVAGASRGAGRGIALALGEAGATVYVAGRTTRSGPKPKDNAPGTIEDTAEEITRRGGIGIPVRTDCTAEGEVAALFARIKGEQGKVDVLANAVWGASDATGSSEELMADWGKPFWELPARQWQSMMNAGPGAYYLMSREALKLMAPAGKGLIVGVTDGVMDIAKQWVEPEGYGGQLVWELAHMCINRLMWSMSHEGQPRHVAVVTLMPGFMQTERVMAAMQTEELKKMYGFDKSESVEYIGRATAALAADPQVMSKTGKIHFVADLAKEYGFTDIDGQQVPRFNPMA